MHSPWKRFWLELFTSKTWDNGYSVGRILWTWISGDIASVFVMLYRIFYKEDEWDHIYNFLIGMAWFNLIVFLAFSLLVVRSILKEKRGREFLRLLAMSIRSS